MSISILVGHGKSRYGKYNPGACGSGYEEFQIAKVIAKNIFDTLQDTDCDVELVNFEGNMNLYERIAKYTNDTKTDLLLEIHLNAGNGTGTEVYYYDGDSIGKSYAATISQSISNTFNIRDRGAKPGISFGIIRETKPRALLVECCFIDSSDLELVKTSEGQRKMGQAIAQALIKIFDLKPKVVELPMYRIQCGAFTIFQNAEELGKKLLDQNIGNYILRDYGYYKVIAGTFSNKEYAFKELERIRQLGFDAVIIIK